MKKRDLLIYIENLEERIVRIQQQVNVLEARSAYIPTLIGNNSHTWVRPDCGCPPSNICGSTACPRGAQITCQVSG